MTARNSTRSSASHGIAIPAALIMILLITSLASILSHLTTHNLREVAVRDSTDRTYLAAEGALHKQISEMSVYGTLWEQRPNLSTQPSGYTEYYPIAYYSTNGIPYCTGVACHRNMYPTGGGLIKNLGPVGGDGEDVDSSYPITDQLDPSSLPDADQTLAGVSAWTQVERLDESTPGTSNVGGTLSNSVAEGGNAKYVRYRITGISTKNLRNRRGYATVVAVVEMPLT